MRKPPIGIFDSGVGGLGIMKEVAKILPNEDIVYLGDNKNLPFGTKTDEEIQKITTNIMNYLISHYNIKIAVAACNTATVSSIKYLRDQFKIPIIGVVPVVKPACLLSKTKKIAIMATPVTINSESHKELIKNFAIGVDVINIPCPHLVELIENNKFDSNEIENLLKDYLRPVLNDNIDVIGLGCTHYPFLYKLIQEIVPSNVVIMDSNNPVATQVKRILHSLSEDLQADISQFPANYSFFCTLNPEIFYAVALKMVPELIKNVELIELN